MDMKRYRWYPNGGMFRLACPVQMIDLFLGEIAVELVAHYDLIGIIDNVAYSCQAQYQQDKEHHQQKSKTGTNSLFDVHVFEIHGFPF